MDALDIRQQLCLIGQLMRQHGYIDGTSGNISARLAENAFLVTPSGIAKGFMKPEQLIIVDSDGERIDAPTPDNAHLRPTSEILMHLEAYRQRPDVGGVVHAHPPYAVALTIAGYDFRQPLIPEMIVMLGIVPVTDYATPSSAENRDAIRELVRQHDAILLAHHGSLTVAKSAWDAYLLLETLEHSAQILTHVQALGGAKSPLALSQVAKLLATRRQLGLWRQGDDERFGI